MDEVEKARTTYYRAGDQFLQYCLRLAEETGDYTRPSTRRSVFQSRQIPKADLAQLVVVREAARTLEEEQANLRRAFQWAALRQDYESAADLVYALGDHLADWGHVAELEDWSNKVLKEAIRAEDSHTTVMMQRALGYMEAERGNWNRALKLYTQALAALKEDDVDVRASLHHFIGLLFSRKGAWDQALEWLESAKQEFARLEDFDGLSSVYIALGGLYRRVGDWEKAESCLAEARGLCEELGDLVADLSPLYNNLGGLCQASGRLEEAIDYFRKDLAISQQAGIPQSLGTARLCLAAALIQAQSFDEAYELLELARADFEHLDDMAGLAELELVLGNALLRQAKSSLSAQAYERAQDLCRKLDDTRGLARAYSGMAAASEECGDTAQSKVLYGMAASIYEQMDDIRGAVDDFTWTIRQTYADHGDQAEAIERYNRLMTRRELQGIPREIASICGSLGDVYVSGRDWAEARTFYEKELAIQTSLHNNREIAGIYSDLGSVYGHMAAASGDESLHAQAIASYLLAVTMQEELGNQLDAAWTYEQLGDLWCRKDRRDDAERYYARALAIGRKVGDPSLLGWVLSDLGHLHVFREDWEKAIEFHSEALAQRKLCADQTLVAYSYENLAYCYRQTGALDQSLNAYRNSAQCWEHTGNMAMLGLAHQTMGNIHVQRHDLDLAIDELEAARTLLAREHHAELVNVIRSLAYVDREQSRWGEATSCYEAVLSIAADTLALADVAEVHRDLADSYAAMTDWKNAALHYNVARSSYWQCGDSAGVAYTALSEAQARAELGDVDSEINAYREALLALNGQDQIPNPAIIHIGLGNAYSKKKAWQEAVQAYAIAADLAIKSGDDSGAASAQWHLGVAQLEAGRRLEAADHFHIAASLERQAGNQEQADEVDNIARSLGIR